MISRATYEAACRRALAMLDNAGIALTAAERQQVEVADFGLNDLEQTGLELIVYVNNDRYCAKELVLLPRQTCPEHRHPRVADDPGKRETFRVRSGIVWLYMPGTPAAPPKARLPKGSEAHYTVFHEIELRPGEQYTLPSDTLHWFQAGDAGAVVSEFSSSSRDDADVFTDPRIQRAPKIAE